MAIVATDSQRRGKGGSKPGERRGGRQKGTPNKINGQVKEMILEALGAAGGVEYLTRQADENPGPFMTLLGKVIPLQVAGDPENPVNVAHTVKIVAVPSQHGR